VYTFPRHSETAFLFCWEHVSKWLQTLSMLQYKSYTLYVLVLPRPFTWRTCEPRRSGFKFQIAVINVLCDVPNTGVFCSVSTKCVHGMTSSSVWACKAGCQVPSRRTTASKDLCGMCRRPLTARRNPSIVVGHVLRNFNRLTYDCGAASTKTTFRMVSPPIKASLVRWK